MPTAAEAACAEILDSLVKRDGSVEITPILGKDDQIPPTARVRLLARTGKGMVIDRPLGQAFTRHMVEGTRLHVLVADGPDRWEFHTTVLGTIQYRLNDATEVPAIAIGSVGSVRSAQRREYFRVTIGSVLVKSVRLTPVLSDAQTQTGTDEAAGMQDVKPFDAKLINIGGGGIGVITPQRVAWQLPLVRRYQCSLPLPTRNTPVVIPADVVRLEEQEDGTTYMGLQFDFENLPDRHACADAICHFTAWHQRQILQRRKERE